MITRVFNVMMVNEGCRAPRDDHLPRRKDMVKNELQFSH